MPPKYSREITRPVVLGESLKEQFRTSPCQAACPAGNSIQKLQSLVEQGDFAGAQRYLRAKNPFSAVTGRVCPQFCKTKCNRQFLDEAVNIRAIERAAGDLSAAPAPAACRPATGKRVAVIGGGPAGLTSAWFLALLGHAVTVYEAGPVLGGMVRHAVPDFRLPRQVADLEIGRILEAGVQARLNCTVGVDISLAELCGGNDAVIVATGTPLDNMLPIAHAELALKAVDFLKNTALGRKPLVGRKVAVMGGGGVAFDCAFTAKRLGAEEVRIICLEKEGALRAPEEDLEQARAEGILLHSSSTMSAIRAIDGRVQGVDYFRVRDCRFDVNGKLTLEAEPGGEATWDCDTVIMAVGTRTDLEFLAQGEGARVEINPRRCIVVNARQSTARPGLFAAGDVSSGPASIAEAVGTGRSCAFGVHAWLGGEEARVWLLDDAGFLEPCEAMAADQPPHVVGYEDMYGTFGAGAQTEKVLAQAMPRRDELSFAEINLGYDRAQAMAEAARCLHCGHCKACGTCVDDCPGYVLEMKDCGQGEQPCVSFGEECWHCANCRTSCPCGAIAFAFPLRMLV